jgi:hypothetical protein
VNDVQGAYARASQVREAHQGELLAKANVVGVGVGLRSRGGAQTQEVVLVVMVSQKVPQRLLAEEDLIPDDIDGVPVDVQAVGELRALS